MILRRKQYDFGGQAQEVENSRPGRQDKPTFDTRRIENAAPAKDGQGENSASTIPEFSANRAEF